MAWGQEVKDFVGSFKSGYDMVKSPDEKKQERARTRALEVASDTAETELGWKREDRPLDIERQRTAVDATRAGIDATRSGIDVNRENIAAGQQSRSFEAEKQGEWRGNEDLRRREAEAGIAGTEAVAENNRQTARKTEFETDEKQARSARIAQGTIDILQKFGMQVDPAPQQAVPTGATPGEANAGQGPTRSAAAVGNRVKGQSSKGSKWQGDDRDALFEVADGLGISPLSLAGVMHYETGGFRRGVNVRGGKGGNYEGVIQFGPAERKQYGYVSGMTMAEQLRGPVRNYLIDRGLKPGMGTAELYSIINAGSLDRNGQPRWNASDGNGNVRSHAEKITREHEPAAAAMFDIDGDGSSLPMLAGTRAGPITPKGNRAELIATSQQATKEGLLHLTNALGLNERTAVPTPEREAAMDSWVSGDGTSADPDDMTELGKITRSHMPNGAEASEALVNHANLAAVYQVYANEGTPEAMEQAQAAAASIIQHYKKAGSQYLSVAKAAAEGGEMDEAAKAYVRAYSYVPDGSEVSIEPQKDGEGYDVVVTDLATGKPTTQALMSPDELFARIMDTSPADFTNYIMAAAGQSPKTTGTAISPELRATLPAPLNTLNTHEEVNAARLAMGDGADGGGRKGASVTDRTSAYEAMAGFTEEAIVAKEEAGDPLSPGEAEQLTNIASNVWLRNSDTLANPRVAYAATVEMLNINPEQPDVSTFQAQKMEDGTYNVAFNNQQLPSLVLTTDEFRQVVGARAAQIQQLGGDAADAAKPGVMRDLFGEGGVTGAISGLARRGGQAVMDFRMRNAVENPFTGERNDGATIDGSRRSVPRASAGAATLGALQTRDPNRPPMGELAAPNRQSPGFYDPHYGVMDSRRRALPLR